MSRRSASTRRALAGVVACLVLAPGLWGCGSPEPAFSGMVRDPAPEVGSLALPDVAAGGRPMALRAVPNGILLVYFGYTMCPDVCPTTMSDVRLALEDLSESDRERVQVALVTVDPERDTAAVLGRYVRHFVPDGHALRTTDASLLREVARGFGAGYEVRGTPEGEVEVSHTAFVYAVDGGGRLVLQWAFGTRWEALRDDVEALLARIDRDA